MDRTEKFVLAVGGALIAGVIGLVVWAVIATDDGSWVGEGTVVSRSYDDPDDTYRTVVCGKTTCMVPDHDPAHWWLKVEDGEGKRHNVQTGEVVWSHCFDGAQWADQRCVG